MSVTLNVTHTHTHILRVRVWMYTCVVQFNVRSDSTAVTPGRNRDSGDGFNSTIQFARLPDNSAAARFFLATKRSMKKKRKAKSLVNPRSNHNGRGRNKYHDANT